MPTESDEEPQLAKTVDIPAELGSPSSAVCLLGPWKDHSACYKDADQPSLGTDCILGHTPAPWDGLRDQDHAWRDHDVLCHSCVHLGDMWREKLEDPQDIGRSSGDHRQLLQCSLVAMEGSEGGRPATVEYQRHFLCERRSIRWVESVHLSGSCGLNVDFAGRSCAGPVDFYSLGSHREMVTAEVVAEGLVEKTTVPGGCWSCCETFG